MYNPRNPSYAIMILTIFELPRNLLRYTHWTVNYTKNEEKYQFQLIHKVSAGLKEGYGGMPGWKVLEFTFNLFMEIPDPLILELHLMLCLNWPAFSMPLSEAFLNLLPHFHTFATAAAVLLLGVYKCNDRVRVGNLVCLAFSVRYNYR